MKTLDLILAINLFSKNYLVIVINIAESGTTLLVGSKKKPNKIKEQKNNNIILRKLCINRLSSCRPTLKTNY